MNARYATKDKFTYFMQIITRFNKHAMISLIVICTISFEYKKSVVVPKCCIHPRTSSTILIIAPMSTPAQYRSPPVILNYVSDAATLKVTLSMMA